VGKRAGLALGGPGLAASPSLGGGRGRGGPAGNVPKKARGKEVRLLCRKGRGGRAKLPRPLAPGVAGGVCRGTAVAREEGRKSIANDSLSTNKWYGIRWC